MSAPRRRTKEEINAKREERKEDEQNVKDLKFAIGGFFVLVAILTHYAWVMRQLIFFPDISYTMKGVHFGLLGVTIVTSIWLFIKFVYRKVYADDIKELKRQKDETKKQEEEKKEE